MTVPTGDKLFLSVVRIVMRAMFLFRGQSGVQVVEGTPLKGILRLVEVASAATPTQSQIEREVNALYATLGMPAPITVLAPKYMDRPPAR